jgi:hypothetical protein
MDRAYQRKLFTCVRKGWPGACDAAWPATLVALTEELETKDLIPFIDEIFEITYNVVR